MTTERATLSAPRLRQLARGGWPPPAPDAQHAGAPAALEPCGLCAAPVAPEHRHVLDIAGRRLLCACRACAVLFDRRAAGGDHFRLVPDRVRLVQAFAMDEARWAALGVPVEMAFFFHSTPAGRVVAFYPSPAGPVESLLELAAWEQLAAENPVLAQLEPDVEALLVQRTRGAHEHWLVPVDACYRLVGVIRARWRGFAGGEEVWAEIATYFDDLRRRAERVGRDGRTLA